MSATRLPPASRRAGVAVMLGLIALMTAALLLSQAGPAGAQVETQPVRVYAGTCAEIDPDNPVVELNDVAEPEGDFLGADEAAVPAVSITAVELPLDEYLATTHSIAVHPSADELETTVACGEIGGVQLVDTGAVAVGLREQNGSGATGLAYLAPADGTSVISVYVAVGLAEEDAGLAATPAAPAEAEEEAATPEAT